MRVVEITQPGGPEVLRIASAAIPEPGPGQVRIRVLAAGLNRADSLQREGNYRPPRGASEIPGLEVSGTVDALGDGVAALALGTPVMALLSGGGYAEYVLAAAGSVLPIPEGVDPIAAAGLPEVAATTVSNLLGVGRFTAGETVLIHGATGGVGVFATQLIHALGGRVAVTASTEAKLEQARLLGATVLINYRTQDFAVEMVERGGADLILDTVGGDALARNLQSLRPHGRIVTIATQGGRIGELDFGLLMAKKASITGTRLRDRPDADKVEIMRAVGEIVVPLLVDRRIQPVIDRVFPLGDVVAAHRYFDSGTHLGKVLLDVRA